MSCETSQCGKFIAVVINSELQIHSLTELNDPIIYYIDRILRTHYQTSGYSIRRRYGDFKVHQLEWELLAGNSDSTKIAAYVTDSLLHLIMVFDLAERNPIIMEQDPIGVARFQWIPPPQEAATDEKSGAYTNSTQLAVFMNHGLELRVYSLECTHVLFTIPKPFVSELILRPKPLRMWSVLALPYYAKNLTSRSILSNNVLSTSPVLHHFYNHGNTSVLMALLPLSFLPSSSAKFSWSEKGKWLLCFDDRENMYGYTVRIFNLLAIHDKYTRSPAQHIAQSTIEFKGSLDGQRSTAASKTSEPRCLSAWGNIDESEFILAISSGLDAVPVKIFDITHAAALPAVTLNFSDGVSWSQTTDFQKNVRYRRMFHASPSLRWTSLVSFGPHHVLSSSDWIVILHALFKSHVAVEVVCSISASLRFLKAHKLRTGRFVLAFADHVAVQSPNAVEVIATSRYQFKSANVYETSSKAVVVVVEETPSGPVWRLVTHTLDKRTDKTLGLIGQTEYSEDSSKVMKLIKDAHRSDLGLRRDTREATDTFQTSKRRKHI